MTQPADIDELQPTDSRLNLLGQSESALQAFFADLGEKPFRARQVLQWMHQRETFAFDEMTDLSKALRARLAEVATVRMPTPLSELRSGDGTVKWLFASGAGQAIETVFIPGAKSRHLVHQFASGLRTRLRVLRNGRAGFQSQPDD